MQRSSSFTRQPFLNWVDRAQIRALVDGVPDLAVTGMILPGSLFIKKPFTP
jgi:hypothetical protein